MMGVRIEGQCPKCKGHLIEFDYIPRDKRSLVIYCVLCGRNKDSYPIGRTAVQEMAKEWGLQRAENNIGTIQGL